MTWTVTIGTFAPVEVEAADEAAALTSAAKDRIRADSLPYGDYSCTAESAGLVYSLILHWDGLVIGVEYNLKN